VAPDSLVVVVAVVVALVELEVTGPAAQEAQRALESHRLSPESLSHTRKVGAVRPTLFKELVVAYCRA
jgi:hypothetical protein